MEYSTRGLVTKITEPSQQATNITAWDNEGRVTAMQDGVGTAGLTYWENGLPKEATETISGAARTSYRGYDRLNRLVEYRDGEGNTLRYSYYPDNRLKTITYPDGVKTVTYTYDDFGRLKTVTDWANRTTTYHYDAASRLERIDRPNNTKRELAYTDANELRQVTERAANGSVIWFTRLTRDDDSRITDRFVRPAAAAFTPPIDTMTFDADNRIATFGGATVVHDDDGNMTSGPLPSGTTATYSYDARNRLTAAGGVSYRYATDGQRVSVTSEGAVTSYAVDPNTSLSRTLVRTKGGVTTYYVYGATLLYEETNGSTKTYHYDHVGSTIALTAGDGNTVTDRVQYGSFGATASRTGTSDTPFLYHGAWGVMTDPNGLHYMRARYYNARTMRFINADPIGFGGGMNWYAFASNSPTHNIDPWGLKDRGAANSEDGGRGFSSVAAGSVMAVPLGELGRAAVREGAKAAVRTPAGAIVTGVVLGTAVVDGVVIVYITTDVAPVLAPITFGRPTAIGSILGVPGAQSPTIGFPRTGDLGSIRSDARTIGELWKDLIDNPDDWEKIDERSDPRQPRGGESVREVWRKKDTGETIGLHRKTPPGTRRDGSPRHPHPFPPSLPPPTP
ncbi:MAG: RHS repeat-associated core domain-containing protein [Opitutaceae bacterium]